MQKWCFCTTGHRLGTSGAPAIFAAPVTEAYKIHTSSALSPARLIFSPSLACPKLEVQNSHSTKQKKLKILSHSHTVFDFSILFPRLHFTLILNSFTLKISKFSSKSTMQTLNFEFFHIKKKWKILNFDTPPFHISTFSHLGFSCFHRLIISLGRQVGFQSTC